MSRTEERGVAILEIFAEAQRKGHYYDPAAPDGKLTDIRKLQAGLPKAQWRLLDALSVTNRPGKAGPLVGMAPRSARRASGFLESRGLVVRTKTARPKGAGGQPEWLAVLTEKGWERLLR